MHDKTLPSHRLLAATAPSVRRLRRRFEQSDKLKLNIFTTKKQGRSDLPPCDFYEITRDDYAAAGGPDP